MDAYYLLFWLQVCMNAWLSQAATENFLVSVTSNMSVHTMQTTILPCWLSPPQSAEDMEVNWFHSKFDTPIMLYKDKTINNASRPASYSDRVSFGHKDASSTGLKAGDVSLKLVNVTTADAGEYTCYVSSDKHHDHASLNLFVSQTGVEPLLTAVVNEVDKMNVSCESEGWYPKPLLHWSDGSSALTAKALVHRKTSTGFYSVHSWLIVPSSFALSCSVGLPGEKTVQGRLHMHMEIPSKQEQPVAGWVLFAIAAIFLAALILFGLLKYRSYLQMANKLNLISNQPSSMLVLGADPFSKHASNEDPSESEKLLDTDYKYVNIDLEKNGNESILIKNNRLRESCDAAEKESRVTCATAVRGSPEITSGKHYWEVSLAIKGNAEIPAKKSWWIGVTSRSDIPKDCDPTIANGFWFLSSSPDNEGVLQFNTNTNTFLGVSVQPSVIGVYLDYDKGTLHFYDEQKKSLIGYIQCKFLGPIFPLFNPGLRDQVPMEIQHRKKKSHWLYPVQIFRANFSSFQSGAQGPGTNGEQCGNC